ncbi:MAG: cupin domain-containing protein [Parcubacteria group bacterium]
MIHIRQADAPWTERPGYGKRVLLTGDQIGAPGTLVQMLRIRPGEGASPHYHQSCTETFFFFAGTGEWTVNGEKVTLQTGDVLVIQPGDRYSVRNPGTEDLIYIAFKVNVVDDDYFESES